MLTYYQMYTPNKSELYRLWISFYYSCQGNICFENKNICSNLSYQEKYHDVYCYNTSTMNIIRYVLSSILIFIILLMFFDIYRIIKIKNSLNNRILSQDLVNQAEKFQIVITLLLAIYYGILMIFIFVVDGECNSIFQYQMEVHQDCHSMLEVQEQYVRGRFSRTTYFEKLLNQQLNESEIQQNYEFKTIEEKEESFYSAQE
ncbi:unnamed protein product (macronuclear) [Paramecium tetraurelia]|uniref:Transmembrane protein n=1 Tax=Paramecium tetraurelia TaxID=5888 RepID=A0DW70_PARTE|nr:uncharacterized protein GSPATT00020940001 [Paramecium tetraurelia]CAK87287.1 unnamed protein product [Paramecium tetraurelia]|eukprot:XP_001454684.1 hypothetical protein (macronuclear) [Paramecium tetraurelia strain d4-2]